MVRWNSREVVVTHGTAIHGSKFDYSMVTDECVTSNTSKIPLRCNTCDYKWSPSISSHINAKSGCPRCSQKLKLSLEDVIRRSHEVHGHKFDYSSVTRSHVINGSSKIPLKCNTCEYQWLSTITNHINRKRGCPKCGGRRKWTLEEFLHEAYKIHDVKFDYSDVSNTHITGKTSKIPLKCNTCGYCWSPTIHDHINSKSGCPKCCGNLKITLHEFIARARVIHGYKFDYSLIEEYHVENIFSVVPVICRECAKIWNVTMSNHINHFSGCPNCSKRRSKGEISITGVLDHLKSVGIINWYCMEYTYTAIPEISRRAADFMCIIHRHDGTIAHLLIEYDGRQHFEEIAYFKTPLSVTHDIDIKKTFLPLLRCESSHMLRIDHKLYVNTSQIINDVIEHIKVNPKIRLFLYSKYDSYDHILESDLNQFTYDEIYYDSTYTRE